MPSPDRDLIAVFAMQGMLAHARPYKPSKQWTERNPHTRWHACLAKEAYEIAGAMIKARYEASKARDRAEQIRLKGLESS